RGERGAPGAVAEEHEVLVFREDGLVIRALGVGRDLEHAARAVEGAGDHALALQLAHVAQVDEHDVVLAEALLRVLQRQRLDARLGLVDELAEPFLELHAVVSFTSPDGRLTTMPSSNIRFDWAATVLAATFTGGVFLDGWAHTHGRVDDTFFTPWHAALYSGFVLMAALLAGRAAWGVAREGGAWRGRLRAAR